MAASRRFIPVLIVLMIVVPLGLAWAVQANGMPALEAVEPIAVQTDGREFQQGDTIRIWIRNVGTRTLEGTPRLLVLNEDGGVVQSFAFAQFFIELEPGESVWADWATGPRPYPCFYGKTDAAQSAEPSIGYPCPMVAESGDGAPPDADGRMCHPCVPSGMSGSFILVGIFGGYADAHAIRLA